MKDYEFDDDLAMRKISGPNIHNNSVMNDSENLSVEDRSEMKYNIKRVPAESQEKSVEGNGVRETQGPVTRRKEHQMLQANGKTPWENKISGLDTLKKFDDFYKEKKNVEHEMYFYRPPRVNPELYQVPIENIDTNNSYSKENNINQNTGKFSIFKN